MSESKSHLVKMRAQKKAFFCAADQRVLDAALDAGHALPHSCRGGNCGRCVAQVSGPYDYDRPTPPPGITAEQRQGGQALLCQIVPQGPLVIDVAHHSTPDVAPVIRIPSRIVRRERVAPDVMKLSLQLPRTQPIVFEPGQYLDVLLDRGRRRSYSIANWPTSEDQSDQEEAGATLRAAAGLELHIRRVEGGVFSRIAFDESATSLLRIEGPLGRFGWRPHAGPVVLVAGGTGYAPIKSMLLSRIARGETHPTHLFWGARNQADLYEHDAVRAWQQAHDWFTYTPVLRDSAENPRRLYEHAVERFVELDNAMMYVAGPPGLIQRIESVARDLQIDPDRVITDSFDYAVT
ncbi:MAG: 2Fe-2S iron-sulfur cluster-binding protein [Pseudomonadota bacterium]